MIQRQTANPSVDKDAVFVETSEGERGVEGIVEQLDGERLQINYQSKSRNIGVAKINAIVMAELGFGSSSWFDCHGQHDRRFNGGRRYFDTLGTTL